MADNFTREELFAALHRWLGIDHPGVSRRLYDWRSPRSIVTLAVVLAVLLTGYVCARASQHPL